MDVSCPVVSTATSTPSWLKMITGWGARTLATPPLMVISGTRPCSKAARISSVTTNKPRASPTVVMTATRPIKTTKNSMARPSPARTARR